jgi:hypothetical protein
MTIKTYIELIEQQSVSMLTEKSMFHSDSDTGHLLGELEKLNALLDNGEYHGLFELKHIGPVVRPMLRKELKKLQDSGHDIRYEEMPSLLTSTFVIHCELELAHAIVADVFSVLNKK